jgi:uncharacterized protein (DUF58 family)
MPAAVADVNASPPIATAPRARWRQPRSLRETLLLGRLIRGYEERLTARGRALLWATGGLALLGLDTRRSQVYALFAVAAAALVLALLVNLLARPRVNLECVLPARMTAHSPLTLEARLQAPKDLPLLCLMLPRPLRWGSSIVVEPRQSFVSVTAGQPTRVKLEIQALRRGRYELRGATVRATDPLRLATSRSVRANGETLLVYPRFYRMDDFVVPLGRRYHPGGIPLSSSTGDAIEFVGTRDYRIGDAVKNIHWRSWARRGQPVVKEYQEEYFCRIALVLDTFLPARPRAAERNAFEAALSVTASIADHFSRSEHIVDILAAGPDIYEVSTGRSLGYLDNILDVLACLEPSPARPFETITPHLFEKLSQISTVVAVLQDWDAPRAAFLRRVRALGTAVRAVVVHSGATSEPWQAVGEELGQVSQFTPEDVEALLQADPPAWAQRG